MKVRAVVEKLLFIPIATNGSRCVCRFQCVLNQLDTTNHRIFKTACALDDQRFSQLPPPRSLLQVFAHREQRSRSCTIPGILSRIPGGAITDLSRCSAAGFPASPPTTHDQTTLYANDVSNAALNALAIHLPVRRKQPSFPEENTCQIERNRNSYFSRLVPNRRLDSDLNSRQLRWRYRTRSGFDVCSWQMKCVIPVIRRRQRSTPRLLVWSE